MGVAVTAVEHVLIAKLTYAERDDLVATFGTNESGNVVLSREGVRSDAWTSFRRRTDNPEFIRAVETTLGTNAGKSVLELDVS